MKSRPNRVSQSLLAATLACGATALIGIFVIWAVGVYRTTFDPDTENTYLNFLANGEPIVSTFVFSQNYRKSVDLDGNPIEMTDETGFANSSDLSRGRPPKYGGDGPNWSYRILGFVDDQQPPNYWYLVHDGETAGHAYFEGFSAATKRRVGYIGTSGFHEQRIAPEEQFILAFGHGWNSSQVTSPGGTYNLGRVPRNGMNLSNSHVFQPWLVFLNGGDAVYEVNLANRTVRQTLTDPHGRFQSLDMGSIYAQSGERNWLAVRDDDSIHLLSREGEPLTLPLAPELRGHELQIVPRPEGYTVVATTRIDFQRAAKHQKVYSVASDGTLGPPRDVTVTDFPPSSFVYEAPLLLSSPALLTGSLLAFRPDELLMLETVDTWESGVALGLRQYGLYLLFTIVAGSALAVACYRRQARFQLSRGERVAWPLFVFLFGIPGWVGYRYCRRWPPLDVCPMCHEMGPQDQEICAVCGRGFPLPESKGTEIFA